MSHRTRRKRDVYSSSDYNSNDGMLTSVWGPALWHYLHTMSFNYPVEPSQENKEHYRDFVLNLQYVLPCGKCRKNLTKTFRKFPLIMETMESRGSFSKYIYDLHEIVNEMLDKKSGLSYEDIRERYEHFRARCEPGKRGGAGANRTRSRRAHKGCTVPLYGKKSRCLLQIVPNNIKTKTLRIDERCVRTRLD